MRKYYCITILALLGTVLMMSIDMKPKFTDNEKKMVKTAANFLGKHMES